MTDPVAPVKPDYEAPHPNYWEWFRYHQVTHNMADAPPWNRRHHSWAMLCCMSSSPGFRAYGRWLAEQMGILIDELPPEDGDGGAIFFKPPPVATPDEAAPSTSRERVPSAA